MSDPRTQNPATWRHPLPAHLAARSAQGPVTGQPVAQFEIGDYQNFIYLILDWDRRAAAVVDPQADLDPWLSFLQREKFTLDRILLTHTHFDHVAGVPRLLELFPDLMISVHPRDQTRLKAATISGRCRPAAEGDIIHVGTHSVHVLHTPGHSAGECSYWLKMDAQKNHLPSGYLFTGDTLFIRDCGRTDLESGSVVEMFHSLQRMRTLPADTVVLPGHHYRPECASTLEREWIESPPFHCHSVEELDRLP